MSTEGLGVKAGDGLEVSGIDGFLKGAEGGGKHGGVVEADACCGSGASYG